MAAHRPAVTSTRNHRSALATRAALALVVLISACAPAQRIVAFGDVHGDLDATRRALRLAGAIDDQDRWIGGRLIVVQTGDQLDRGDDERAILELFDRLRVEAAASGGAFHALLGNHELMNVRSDLRYVTEGGFEAFDGNPALYDGDPRLAEIEPGQRGRVAAFLPGGPYAQLLAERDLILQLDGTVFVHGGVLPAHVSYGLERINDETRRWLRGEAELPEILVGSESPQWTRLYSRDPDAEACETLSLVLEALEAERMVMGHTVQPEGITSACDGRVWRIDTGMSSYYEGPLEVLEIVEDSVRILRPNG
ncbi:MAG TPA: metallophosphoesterase [Longimicrobiales bacterium]|nr:metallophosphoesterase [Longimicrobiales bacterium]